MCSATLTCQEKFDNVMVAMPAWEPFAADNEKALAHILDQAAEANRKRGVDTYGALRRDARNYICLA